MDQLTNFYHTRLAPLGVTNENNRIRLENPDYEAPMPQFFDAPCFSEDKEGNIVINFWTIDRQLINYTKVGDGKTSHLNASVRPYKLLRLREPKGDMKYRFPSSDGTTLGKEQSATYPWFAPALCDAYENATKIETLYITEGCFKAWKACLLGIPCIGLTSITHYADNTKQLHSDIVRLIDKCDVENVVILWDGDCLNISKKDLAERTNLARRPYGFFAAAKKLRDHLRGLQNAPSVWLGHVKSETFEDKPKGLDDLLIAAEKKGNPESVVDDAKSLCKHEKKSFFFIKFDITNQTQTLVEYFRLEKTADGADAFYRRHAMQIGQSEFFYFYDQYKYMEEDNELKLLAPGWAQTIEWIGDEFFELKIVPGARQERRVLIPRKEGTLKKLYGDSVLRFVRDKHCVAFCNVPNHFNYQQIIERPDGGKFYNRYFPFRYAPAEGNCPTVLNFVKHIFGDQEIEHNGRKIRNWELGLDYIQLLLTKPTQMLPVLCLYSPENATGKSTFTNFLIRMFGDNALQVGNADLQSDFNEQYADKLLIICEETLLERKRDAERIKAMSTAPQISVNPKGQRQFTIDFFGKFIFNSNNRRMIYVSRHDERFWIIQVNKFTGKDNPRMLQDMVDEIPQFVNMLKRRKLATDSESRMWFHNSLVRTRAFEEAVKVNEPQEASNLREQVRDMFLQEEDIATIEMTMKEIQTEFFSAKTSQKWIQELLKDYLNTDLMRDADGLAVFKRGEYVKYEYNEIQNEWERKIKRYRGRPYLFERANFIDPSVDKALDNFDLTNLEVPTANNGQSNWETAKANANGVVEPIPF